MKVHNNKTSVIIDNGHELFDFNVNWIQSKMRFQQLNAEVSSKTTEEREEDDRVSSDTDDSDTEDQIYQDFLKRALVASDTDDEDFVYELNGEDESDTDSQSSVATDDLSDEDIENRRSTKVSISHFNSILFDFPNKLKQM